MQNLWLKMIEQVSIWLHIFELQGVVVFNMLLDMGEILSQVGWELFQWNGLNFFKTDELFHFQHETFARVFHKEPHKLYE